MITLTLSEEQLSTVLYAVTDLVKFIDQNAEFVADTPILDGRMLADLALDTYTVVLSAAMDSNISPKVIKMATIDKEAWNMSERMK